MRILFIQDNAINESLALTELAGFLEARGHQCDLLIEKEEKDVIRKAESMSPDMVVIPCSIAAHLFSIDMARRIREVTEAPIVFGGSHATFFPEVIEQADIDYLLVGECEESMLELVNCLEKGKDTGKIRGVWKKDGKKVRKNPIREPLDDLDRLGLPKRDIYYKYDFIRRVSMKRFSGGRGCPNTCTYCFNPTLRKMYSERTCMKRYTRKKSVSRILEEVSIMKERHPMKTVHFSDDMFTFDRGWIDEFSRRYRKEIGLPFTFNTTAEQMNSRIIDTVAEAGCAGISLGIESANERLRELILRKKMRNSHIIEMAKRMRERGIKVATFNMLANPGETIKDAFDTVRLNQKLKADVPRVTISFPIPQTELYHYAVRKGYLDEEKFRRLYDSGRMGMNVIYRTHEAQMFENLFMMFRMVCKHPELTGLARKMVKMPRPLFLRALPALWPMQEKMFFGLDVLPGIRYYMHTGNPYFRTTNYTSLI